MQARRGPCLGIALALCGCGTEATVDDRFTESEWTFLQSFAMPEPPAVDDLALAALGQRIFFEPSFSGPLSIASDLGAVGEEGRVSCASCHVPDAWFADDRSPGPTSLGAGWTRRNAPSLVDVAYHETFTWDSRFHELADVLAAPLRGKALLNSNEDRLAAAVCANHREAYEAAFAPIVGDCANQAYAMTENIGAAIAAYEELLVDGDAPFDRYLAGDYAAIDDAAKRGLALFIGDGHCAECHQGPLLSDDRLHVTGVAQDGAEDLGGGDGAFRTPSLRNVAETGPYMHAGEVPTLDGVIDFYRWGGDAAGFPGEKSVLITPLEITDEDAADLVAFLGTLTGEVIADDLRQEPAP